MHAQQVIYVVATCRAAQESECRPIKREKARESLLLLTYPKAAQGNSFHPVGPRSASLLHSTRSRGVNKPWFCLRTLTTMPSELLSFFKREIDSYYIISRAENLQVRCSGANKCNIHYDTA